MLFHLSPTALSDDTFPCVSAVCRQASSTLKKAYLTTDRHGTWEPNHRPSALLENLIHSLQPRFSTRENHYIFSFLLKLNPFWSHFITLTLYSKSKNVKKRSLRISTLLSTSYLHVFLCHEYILSQRQESLLAHSTPSSCLKIFLLHSSVSPFQRIPISAGACLEIFFLIHTPFLFLPSLCSQ